MVSSAQYNFDRMDRLSDEGQPFLFVIDFLGQQVEVFGEDDILDSGIQMQFRNFSKIKFKTYESPHDPQLIAFPENLEDYAPGFENVQKNLKLGNSYLTNYTRKTRIETNLNLEEIFYISEAKYKLLYRDQFVCFSPETFVEIKNGRIYTHPMKGTIDAAVENASEELRNSKKEKAEHYTVVDLLRNDLSMVADNVRVDEFQRIDLIRTRQKNLFAMSSEISGDIKAEFSGKIGSLIQKLLPAGSILGAPKPKTLEIILESEGYERGFYTGICGWFDGKDLDSCVMIRFIEQENGKLFFKSGGGITHMSKLEDEYEEMKNKIYVPIH